MEKIEKDKLYKPRQIANNGWIKRLFSDNKDSAYYHIIKLIGVGKLKAENYGLGKTKFFAIRGSEILRFLEENEAISNKRD